MHDLGGLNLLSRPSRPTADMESPLIPGPAVKLLLFMGYKLIGY